MNEEKQDVVQELALVQSITETMNALPPAITTEAEAFKVTDALLAVRQMFNQAEEKRKSYTAPANETIKRINVDFKPITGPLKEYEEQLGSMLDVYADVRVEKDEAKQEVMRGETGDQSLIIPIGLKALPSSKGEVRFRKAYDVEVTDKESVPAEYMMVDSKAVEKAIKAAEGVIEIPGIVFRASHSHAIYLTK